MMENRDPWITPRHHTSVPAARLLQAETHINITGSTQD